MMADDFERSQSLVGVRFSNRYEIRSEIGRGGMGVVYYGYDSLLQRAVAIKVLPASLTYDRQFVERFRQEAVAAAGLHHSGIITIHDVGEAVLAEQGQQRIYFIVMQYLEGTTLDMLLQSRGPLTLPQANHLVRQVGDALDYAHSRGMIHRDIKPSNIMVSPDGQATIMDFGLVRAGESTGLTRTGMVVGTPEYMAPEQALGETVDARSDTYSFGVVIYKMLSGQVPFARTNPMATAYAHVHDLPPSLRQMRSDLPKPVEAVILKALAKAPAERYQRAGLLADDFALAISNKMPVGLKVAATTASLATAGGSATGAKSPLPRLTKKPTPTPAPLSPADATQLIGGAAGRPATPASTAPPAGQGRRSLGLGVIGLVALLLVAVAAAAVLMLSDGSKDTAPPGIAQGGTSLPTATAVAVAANPTATPTPATPATAVPAVASQATATAQPLAAPSATPTLTATATPTASPAATSTASPTVTPQPPTATPTASPTSAPAQPTATATPRTAQTATATTPARPTATSTSPALAVPALGAPADGATATGETTFSWQWSGPALADSQAFEVRLWKDGQPDHYGATGLVRTTSVSFNVANAYGVQQGGSGRYYWTVAVVQTDPYQRIGQEASPRSINIELGGGGGDNGGGGGPIPTPTPP